MVKIKELAENSHLGVIYFRFAIKFHMNGTGVARLFGLLSISNFCSNICHAYFMFGYGSYY